MQLKLWVKSLKSSHWKTVTCYMLFLLLLFCRLHWRSEIMYRRSGLPTVCVWSLECASWRPIRIWLKALPGCRGYQETQGIEGRSARSRQLLGQTINITFLALEDKLIKRTVSVLTFVNYLLSKKENRKLPWI